MNYEGQQCSCGIFCKTFNCAPINEAKHFPFFCCYFQIVTAPMRIPLTLLECAAEPLIHLQIYEPHGR